MQKKSKFLVFMTSFIPGLSHLYLGLTQRAMVFFLLCAAACVGTAGLCFLAGAEDFFIILVFALPIIWFIALIDSLSIADKLNHAGDSEELDLPSLMDMKLDNHKIITVVLSIIPGAGHMYLGLLKEGVELMSIFFFTAFLMGWLNLSLLVFILPVVWFYSLFDAYHRLENGIEDKVIQKPAFFEWFNQHPNWVGWGLIVFGILIIIEKMVAPMISWEIRQYLQTGIVALIFILGGIKLLAGNKIKDDANGDKEELECDNGE